MSPQPPVTPTFLALPVFKSNRYRLFSFARTAVRIHSVELAVAREADPHEELRMQVDPERCGQIRRDVHAGELWIHSRLRRPALRHGVEFAVRTDGECQGPGLSEVADLRHSTGADIDFDQCAPASCY